MRCVEPNHNCKHPNKGIEEPELQRMLIMFGRSESRGLGAKQGD